MKYKVIIQPPALADIEGAYRYIHERAPTRAPDWLDKLYEAMESLEELPKPCSLAPESNEVGQDIRQMLYGKRGGVYRVLFVVLDDQVRILHVRHAAREFLKPDEIDLPPAP